MELILKAAGKEIPCLDWPTAIVGLRLAIDDNKTILTGTVVRLDAPQGKVCSVLRMPSSRLWVSRRDGRGEHYTTTADEVAQILDCLMAGEDV